MVRFGVKGLSIGVREDGPVVLIPLYGFRYCPGMDGVVLNRRNRLKASVSSLLLGILYTIYQRGILPSAIDTVHSS